MENNKLTEEQEEIISKAFEILTILDGVVVKDALKALEISKEMMYRYQARMTTNGNELKKVIDEWKRNDAYYAMLWKYE